MEPAQSVRFRVVFELTLPEADPEDPDDYDKFLDAMKAALENAPMVRCTNILLREAERIAEDDEDRNWRARHKRLRGSKQSFVALSSTSAPSRHVHFAPTQPRTKKIL